MQDDILDLSISLRIGKEIKIDFCSSGERTRKSPDGNIEKYCKRIANRSD
jgi:hypothetical protein